jgi:hypothetical protein
MTSLTLLSKIDSETGELGLIVKTLKHFNYPSVASSGLQIAHDILEHQNGIRAIGSIGDELQALGGIWYVRGQHGYLRPTSYHLPEEDIASDVANMARMHYFGTPVRTDRVNTRSHDEDDAFKSIVELGIKNYRSEMDCELDANEVYDPLHSYFEQTLHSLRIGFRKAEKRFKNVCPNRMFDNIERAVDEAIDHMDWEGQKFTLTYTASKATCYESEEYYW